MVTGTTASFRHWFTLLQKARVNEADWINDAERRAQDELDRWTDVPAIFRRGTRYEDRTALLQGAVEHHAKRRRERYENFPLWVAVEVVADADGSFVRLGVGKA